MKYKPTIGLEIHIELNTKTKMFCGSKNDPDEKHPNINICPVCTGQPGTLPVINKEAVNKVIKVGLALGSKIADVTKWDRKNYFYPDLPKGYQISQYDAPLCVGGELLLSENKKVKIRRIHLEEDTGRLAHFSHVGHSVIDFNRAGVPLMELVTEPDIASGKEAREFAEELQLILRYLDASGANMEKGQMRLEVNLSLSPNASKTLGTKVEIKNLNSFRSLERAVDYEIERQRGLLSEGRKIIQETRGWSDEKQKTFSQREKEEAHDYRYFPEPDLPSLQIGGDLIEELRTAIPELPGQKRERLKTQYGLLDSQINIFVSDKKLAGFFENIISEFLAWDTEETEKSHSLTGERQGLINLAANYILTDLVGLLNKSSAEVDDIRITAEGFAEFVGLIHRGTINSKAAKEVLQEMWVSGLNPAQIIREKGLAQVSDSNELEKTAQEIVNESGEAVADYKKGKVEVLQFLVGEAMKKTKGKSNPQILMEIFKKLIK